MQTSKVITLGSLTIALSSSALSQEGYTSILPETKVPFTATYLFHATESGVPKGYSLIEPAVKPDVSAKTLKSLGIQESTKLANGDHLVTISSDGAKTLYLTRYTDAVDRALVFSGKETLGYISATHQASVRPGIETQLISFELPVVPYHLPGTASFVCRRSKYSELDKFLALPKETTLAYLLYPTSRMATKYPYSDGYVIPARTSEDWDTYLTGSRDKPNRKLSFSGRVNVGELSLPETVTIETNETPDFGKAGRPNVTTKSVFKLLASSAEPLPAKDFEYDQYLSKDAFVENGKKGIQFEKNGKSLDEQFKQEEPATPPKSNSSGEFLAVILGTVLVLLTGAAIWKKSQKKS